jgi:CO/xanthine dehydrogenase Mo-binding subunit
MGLFSKKSATATASPDGGGSSAPSGFFGSALRDAVSQIKAQGGFDSGLSNVPKTQVNLNLIDDKFEKLKKGGKVKAKKMAKGGSVSSASKRADGIAKKGKTKGRMI